MDTYWSQIRKQCEGRPTDYIKRVAYGVAVDTIARAFPKFGPYLLRSASVCALTELFCSPFYGVFLDRAAP